MTEKLKPKPRGAGIRPVALDAIRAEIQAQPRVAMIPEEVAAYSEAITRGDALPPIVVFHDGTAYWLADGFHRFHAARSIGLAAFDCDVRQGDLRDAILHSVGVNETHGIRRTYDDKRRAVDRLLDDADWSQWSDREIARQCRVSPTFVARRRPRASASVYRYAARDGVVYPMRVSLGRWSHLEITESPKVRIVHGTIPEQPARRFRVVEKVDPADRTARVFELAVSLAESIEGLTQSQLLAGCTDARTRDHTLAELQICRDRLTALVEDEVVP